MDSQEGGGLCPDGPFVVGQPRSVRRTNLVQNDSRLLENIGASVETSVDTDSASASLFTLKENLPQVLEILADLPADRPGAKSAFL